MSFKGDLSTIGLAEVFQMISMSQKEGTLVVGDRDSRKNIYFGPSGIKLLSTGLRKGMKLGDMLVRSGKITTSQLDEALENARIQKKLLGEVLIESGTLAEEEVQQIVREQIEEEIYDLFLWKKADFEFVEGPPGDGLKDPEAPVTKLSFDVNGLLLEAVRRADEWSVINQKVPSLDSIFVFCSESDQVEEERSVSEALQRIIRLVDGQNSIADVVEASGVGKFEVCKALCDLQDRGRVRLLTVQELLDLAGRRISQGDRERARKLYMVAAIHAPDDVKVISGTARMLESEGLAREAADYYVSAARLWMESGDLDRALDGLQRAGSLNPENPDVKPAMFEVHASAGNLAEGKALARELAAEALTGAAPDYPRARALLDRIIAVDGADLEFRILRAKVLHRTGPKRELQEELDYIQKNLPVDAREAERYQRELREILAVKAPSTTHATAVPARRPASRTGPRRRWGWAAVVALLLLGLAGAALKLELDARDELRSAADRSNALASREDFEGARRELEGFLAGLYGMSPLQAERARALLSDLGARESTWKDQAAQREADRLRRAEERMRALEESIQAVKDRDPALALQRVRELRKLAEENRAGETMRRAEELASRFEKYLSEALQLKVKADELEKQGKAREAALVVERLLAEYPNTESARNALFPLEIVTRPSGVKVTNTRAPVVVGISEPGRPLKLRMRAGEPVRLLFEKDGYVRQEQDVPSKTIGRIEVPLLEKTEAYSRPLGLSVSGDPVLAGQTLYVPAGDRLYALEVSPFRFLWSAPFEGSLEGSVAVTKDFLAGGTGRGRLAAIERADGERRVAWQVDLPDRPTGTPAVSADGSTLYVSTADRRIRAISLGTGKELWSRELPAFCSLEPVPTEAGVVLGCTDGSLVCVRGPAPDGEAWRVRADGAITALSLAEGTIYAASSDQNLYAVDPARGRQVWRRMLPAQASGRPARIGGIVLAGAKDGRVHFRDAATGEPVATYETQGAIVGGVVVAGSLALFASEDQGLYAFDVAGRSLAWRYRAGGRIQAPPVVGGGRAYFVAGESLHAVALD